MIEKLVWKFSNPSHLLTKQSILECIDQYKQLQDCPDRITKTDFYDQTNQLSNYMKIFVESEGGKALKKNICHKYWLSNFYVSASWFQQYRKNDNHGWHIHSNTNISMSYFVELDDSKHSTEFIDTEQNKTFQLDTTEGDVLIFPSYLIHRSPSICNHNRKTTIAININAGPLDSTRTAKVLD